MPLHSGYAFRTLGILEAQRARGWETLQLTTPRHNRTAERLETVSGWTFHRTPPPPGSAPGSGPGSGPGSALPLWGELREMRATRQRLAALVRETRPDILQAHSPILTAFPALAVARDSGLPLVYELRALWEDAATDHGTARRGGLKYRLVRWLETRVLRQADAVTTICEGLKGEVVARGIAAEKVTVIPNAVDLERFGTARRVDRDLARQLGLEGATVLGFLGSFYHYEGLDLLIEGLARLAARQPAVKLLLAGGGPQEAALRRQAAARGLESRVVFTGRVPHEAVARYYDLVDLFVYPRRRMRLTDLVTPLKPLEAMAKGAVVLASDVGGHRELIAEGERGYLFAADDAGALADKLETVLARRDDWPRLGRAGRRFVEQERTWPHSVAHYAPLYRRLCGAAATTEPEAAPRAPFQPDAKG